MPRTPRSSKIPQWPIDAVVPIAKALADLAGPATNARIAQQVGQSPAAGKFRSKLGTARYYGLTRRDGELHVLTERGEAVLGSDPAIATRAKQEAVMSTTFGEIIRKFSGREPVESTIAARLEDDWGSPADPAAYQAKTLVEAATEAGLVLNGRFDAAAIERVSAEVPAAPDAPSRAAAAQPQANSGRGGAAAAAMVQAQAEADAAKAAKAAEQAEELERERAARAGVRVDPFPQAVQVVVKIDASTWTPEQVGELVKALRAEPEPAGE